MSDDFAEKYMASGEVLFREKQVNRWLLLTVPLVWLVTLAPLFAVGGWRAALPEPYILALLTALSLWSFTLFVARTVVTTTHVELRIGLLGVKVEVASIHAVEDATRNRRRGEVGYAPPSSTGFVRLHYSENGKEKTVLLGTREVGALLAALALARRTSAQGTGVRAQFEAETEQQAPTEQEPAQERVQSARRA